MIILRKLKGNLMVKNKSILIEKNINLNVKINNFILSKGKKNKTFLPLLNFTALFNFITSYLKKEVLFYYYEVKMHGLGFKISVSKARVLRLDLGWSHALVITLPSGVYLLRKKTEFLFYSKYFFLLSNFIFCLKKYYKRNPYYIKGIFDIHEKIIKKLGKQRQK